jgi:uncharacterized protein DUF3179
MKRKLPGMVLLLVCLASRVGAGWEPQGRAVTVEQHKKLQPAGPGQRPFDVTRHTIPLAEIIYNIPRDSIPALAQPRFIAAAEARRELKDSDRVLGVFLKGEAKAYPVRILNWHEVVNDVAGGQPILVSW